MAWDAIVRSCEAAGQEFNRHENRGDGATLLASLGNALSLLRDSLYLRLHEDVEQLIGQDTMLMPVSEIKVQRATKAEIELYQVAECTAAARAFGYLATSDDWFWQWLNRLRGDTLLPEERQQARIADYLALSADQRRLALTDRLARVLSESSRAPLVLFRLVPLAQQLATALAFGDRPRAEDLRRQQIAELPSLADCHQCRAAVLDNGQQCRECGNPLWKSSWLLAAD